MLSTDEARAQVTTSLSDEALQDVIEREEAWLARRIGPLEGERQETFVTIDGDEELLLQRPTDTVTVDDEQGPIDNPDLRGWSDVSLALGSRSWSGPVVVTYTPTDEAEVKRALVTLVRLAVAESGYVSQSAGGYSSTVSVQDQRTMRFVAWRGLLRPKGASSTRLRSTIPIGGNSVQGVAVVASGS